MKGNPKHLGNKYEREVSKRLSKWITGGKDLFALERKASSGGSKYDHLGLTSSSGDITSTKKSTSDFIKDYHIEVKCQSMFRTEVNTRYDVCLSKYILGKRTKINKIIETAQIRYKASNNKGYLIIFKVPRNIEFFITNCHILGSKWNDLFVNNHYIGDFEKLLESDYVRKNRVRSR